MTLSIRRAVPADALTASRVAYAAKAHWGYPADVLAAWEPELRFTAEYISAHHVLVAEADGTIVGVCAWEEHGTHRDLAHLWVLPSAQGRGVGTALLRRVREECRDLPGPLRVESDPNAEAFYMRAGATRVGGIAAALPSDPGRVLPVLEFAAPGTGRA